MLIILRKDGFEVTFRLIISLVSALLVSACAHNSQVGSTSYDADKMISKCAQQYRDGGVGTYSVIYAQKLSYYIVFAEILEKRYCHIDKMSHDIVYSNAQDGAIPVLDTDKSRYSTLSADGNVFGSINLKTYKLIAGKWRYISTQKSNTGF